jgi:acyl-CoA thioester hydrolase
LKNIIRVNSCNSCYKIRVMARIKIELPPKFVFTTEIPVRITDLNYGAHVGNDTILSLIHEARMQLLSSYGYTSELKINGVGLIMADVGIEFKGELFYDNTVTASVAIGEVSKVGFDLYYKLEKGNSSEKSLIAIAKTGMLCFDYQKKKIAPVPEELRSKLIR